AGGEQTGRKERARKRHVGEGVGVEAADAPLFEALRAWRRERAAEQRVPPYVIFHDSTLSAIARMRPASLDDLEGSCRPHPHRSSRRGLRGGTAVTLRTPAHGAPDMEDLPCRGGSYPADYRPPTAAACLRSNRPQSRAPTARQVCP